MLTDVVLSVLLVLAFGLHVLSLPANWAMLLLFALGAWMGGHAAGVGIWAALVAMALAGEGLEWWLQDRQARRAGASAQGSLVAMVGAVAGAVVGAPFAFGLGGLVGAVAGAYLGCLAGELARGVPWTQARQAAWGALTGRVGGMVAKLVLGAGMLGVMLGQMWAA